MSHPCRAFKKKSLQGGKCFGVLIAGFLIVIPSEKGEILQLKGWAYSWVTEKELRPITFPEPADTEVQTEPSNNDI